MNSKLKILLKKELYEFRYNYKAWILIIITVCFSYFPNIRKSNIRDFTILVFIILAVGQYIYNSYLTDISNKGILFLQNLGIKSIELFFIKILFSFLISNVMILANIPNLKGIFSLIDILWIYPTVISSSAIMQIAATYANGAENTATIISSIISFIILICVFFIKILFLKIIFSCGSALIFFWLCELNSYSLKYRTQL